MRHSKVTRRRGGAGQVAAQVIGPQGDLRQQQVNQLEVPGARRCREAPARGEGAAAGEGAAGALGHQAGDALVAALGCQGGGDGADLDHHRRRRVGDPERPLVVPARRQPAQQGPQALRLGAPLHQRGPHGGGHLSVALCERRLGGAGQHARRVVAVVGEDGGEDGAERGDGPVVVGGVVGGHLGWE
jgi:hypothetical protein